MCATVSGGVSCSGGSRHRRIRHGGRDRNDRRGLQRWHHRRGRRDRQLHAQHLRRRHQRLRRSIPGAAMTGCTDGPNGFMATCCFPAGRIDLSAGCIGRLGLRRGLLLWRVLHDHLSASCHLRGRRRRQRVRRTRRRDVAELRRRGQRIHRRLLLCAWSACVRDGRSGTQLRWLNGRDDGLCPGTDLCGRGSVRWLRRRVGAVVHRLR